MTKHDDHIGMAQTDAGSQRERRAWLRGAAFISSLIGAVPAGLLLGSYLDRRYDTAPTWMVSLSVLFLAVALYQLAKGLGR